MKEKDTIFSNYKIVIDDCDINVAIKFRKNEEFWLYDKVIIVPNSQGHVSRGIKKGGMGKIVEISESHKNKFFGILMDSGEFGFVDRGRMRKI